MTDLHDSPPSAHPATHPTLVSSLARTYLCSSTGRVSLGSSFLIPISFTVTVNRALARTHTHSADAAGKEEEEGKRSRCDASAQCHSLCVCLQQSTQARDAVQRHSPRCHAGKGTRPTPPKHCEPRNEVGDSAPHSQHSLDPGQGLGLVVRWESEGECLALLLQAAQGGQHRDAHSHATGK